MEDETHGKLYDAKIVEHSTRMSYLESNELEVAGLIISDYCHPRMLARLKTLEDYETTLMRNPYELLAEISSQMYQADEEDHFLSISNDAIKRFFNIQQKENESLLDYRERFLTARQEARIYIGDTYLTEMAENHQRFKDEYAKLTDEKDKKEYVQSIVRWQEAIMFMKGADKKKYGAYMKHLKRQYTGDQDQYPRTLDKAVADLRAQGVDTTNNNNNRRNQNRNNNNNNNRQQDQANSNGTSYNSAERYCWVCGDPNHVVSECDERDTRPRRDWEQTRRRNEARNSNRGTNNNQTDSASNGNSAGANNDDGSVASEVTTTPRGSRRGRSYSSFYQVPATMQAFAEHDDENFHRNDLRNALMLDTGTTSTMICNRDLVTDVKISDQGIFMNSNFGGKEIKLRGTLKAIPNHRVWIHEDGSANVLSQSELEKLCDCVVTYEPGIFRVTTPAGKIIEFKRNFQGLFLYWPRKGRSDLATVRGNIEGFTKRQVERAQAARELYHKVGAPTITNLKALLRQNILANCPVTPEDVDLAEKIFGPDAATLKGRTTRSNPTPVKADYIDIPDELLENNRDLHLCIDVIHVNQIPLLTTVDTTIKYRSVSVLHGKSDDDFYEALDRVLRHYNKGGFNITTIHCDREFKSIMDRVSDGMDVTMNYANPGDHVPEIERNNRLLKERIRIAYHRLPYSKLPRAMVETLAMVVAFQLNIFPAKNGISKYYSPYMLVHKRNLDFKKHFQYEFGAYVQAGEVPNKTNRLDSRSVAGIYLRPTTNFQGGHEIFALNSGRVIVRTKITVLPITDHVIEEVNRLGAKQGFKSFKFGDRRKRPDLPDPDQIAGVEDVIEGDNNENDDDDDDYEPDDDDGDGADYDPDDEDFFEPIANEIQDNNNNDEINENGNDEDADADDDDSEDDEEEAEESDDDAEAEIAHVEEDEDEAANEGPANIAGVEEEEAANDEEQEDNDQGQDDQVENSEDDSDDEDEGPTVRRLTRTKTPVTRFGFEQQEKDLRKQALCNRLKGALIVEQEFRKPKAIRFKDDAWNRGKKKHYNLSATENLNTMRKRQRYLLGQSVLCATEELFMAPVICSSTFSTRASRFLGKTATTQRFWKQIR